MYYFKIIFRIFCYFLSVFIVIACSISNSEIMQFIKSLDNQELQYRVEKIYNDLSELEYSYQMAFNSNLILFNKEYFENNYWEFESNSVIIEKDNGLLLICYENDSYGIYKYTIQEGYLILSGYITYANNQAIIESNKSFILIKNNKEEIFYNSKENEKLVKKIS